jgi:hypothetical protein
MIRFRVTQTTEAIMAAKEIAVKKYVVRLSCGRPRSPPAEGADLEGGRLGSRRSHTCTRRSE